MATIKGWEMVWPDPIGSGSFSYALLRSSGGTNSSRGTRRIASSTRSSLICQRIAAMRAARSSSAMAHAHPYLMVSVQGEIEQAGSAPTCSISRVRFLVTLGARAHELEAIATIHGPIASRLVRNLGLLAASRANGGVELSLWPLIVARAAGKARAGPTRCSVGRASLWLVCEAFLCVELLFARGKREWLAALYAT